METRGIRNKNPFNIKRSCNHWHGKIKRPTDNVFEQFTRMQYGIRAGVLLLRNGYLNKGFDTVKKIISRYAPACENNVDRYCDYIYQNSPLSPETKIVFNSLSFFHLCHTICMYESKYNLTYDEFMSVMSNFKLY